MVVRDDLFIGTATAAPHGAFNTPSDPCAKDMRDDIMERETDEMGKYRGEKVTLQKHQTVVCLLGYLFRDWYHLKAKLSTQPYTCPVSVDVCLLWWSSRERCSAHLHPAINDSARLDTHRRHRSTSHLQRDREPLPVDQNTQNT